MLSTKYEHLYYFTYPKILVCLLSRGKFWTPGLPVEVLSNCPRWWSIRPFIHGPSVFKYIKDNSLVFLKLCVKLGVNKVKK